MCFIHMLIYIYMSVVFTSISVYAISLFSFWISNCPCGFFSISLSWSKIPYAVTYEDTGAILRTHFYQTIINCFSLVALTYHTMTNLSFVLFCLLIIPILPFTQQIWICTEGFMQCFHSRTPLTSPAFDSDKHFSISSVTECHLPSTVTYFVFDKPLLPNPTQIVEWEGLLRQEITHALWSVGTVRRWTAVWE